MVEELLAVESQPVPVVPTGDALVEEIGETVTVQELRGVYQDIVNRTDISKQLKLLEALYKQTSDERLFEYIIQSYL